MLQLPEGSGQGGGGALVGDHRQTPAVGDEQLASVTPQLDQGQRTRTQVNLGMVTQDDYNSTFRE